MKHTSAADWPLYRAAPATGTIVLVKAMGHLRSNYRSRFTDADMLPGGMFAEVVALNQRGDMDVGDIAILTRPRSLLDHPAAGQWSWDFAFPFELDRRTHRSGNTMILQVVPAEVADAVRAFVALARADDNLPVTVEDGWLCEGGLTK